jgi:hypothetical protein
MSSTPTVSMHALALLAMISVASAPTVRDDDVYVVRSAPQSHAASTLSAVPSAPIIVAQGRCYNGRCY